MKRRDCLKSSAVLLAGSIVNGCTDHRATTAEPDVDTRQARHGHEMYDSGRTPLAGSGWTDKSGVLPGYPKLDYDLNVDVAIVGAGLAGSSLALHLAETGVSVAVMEARQPGWGASGRNAGHVLPVLKNVEAFKSLPDGGRRFLELFRQHHTIPFDLARKHDFACDAAQSGYLHATNYKWVFERLKKDAEYWQNEQGQSVELLNASDMRKATGSTYYSYGTLYKDGGRVNPYLFTNGMVYAATRYGAKVFGDSEALRLSKAGSGWKIDASEGSITADCVVFCTNAYPTAIVPEFTDCYYPLTAYGVSTQPLPEEALRIIMPGRATLSQEPFDLNPFIIDEHGRIITSSIPSTTQPENAEWHFRNHLDWIYRTWPEAKNFGIELGDYWTGRVALRDRGYPGVFEVQPGVFGVMHFNAWGNVMAPLMGMIFAEAIVSERMDRLPIPLQSPIRVDHPNKQEFIIRSIMLPTARTAQKIGFI